MDAQNPRAHRARSSTGTSRRITEVHLHLQARQFFFVLAGVARLEFDGDTFDVAAGSGIEIEPGRPHRLCNPFETAVEFLVISAPSTKGERVEPPHVTVLRKTKAWRLAL
jgi:mannose-6-phosphate isomerase-like protein (cupin superfamily)